VKIYKPINDVTVSEQKLSNYENSFVSCITTHGYSKDNGVECSDKLFIIKQQFFLENSAKVTLNQKSFKFIDLKRNKETVKTN
jgi:hypothetical protein